LCFIKVTAEQLSQEWLLTSVAFLEDYFCQAFEIYYFFSPALVVTNIIYQTASKDKVEEVSLK